jgi:hypothetical protein
MLTDADIKKLSDVHIEAQKLHFYTKEDMDERFYTKQEMDEKFSNLQTSVDGIARDNLKKNQELTAVTHNLVSLNDSAKSTQQWMDKAAPQLGIAFEPQSQQP